MTYRAEIDGLRAIAVAAVILFHAGFTVAQGGFLGVDVFFVISGYLITSLIVAEHARGTFSFRSFYLRRIRRLLPALAATVLACVPFAMLWMGPVQLESFGTTLLAVALSVSNLIFATQTDYFAADAALDPLLHTWSLAVEEQFYLIFPVALLFLLARKRWTVAVLAGLAVFGWLATEYVLRTGADVTSVFFLPQYRLWEMLIGAITALLAHRRTHIGMTWLGLAMVLVPLLVATDDGATRASWTLSATLGTALILHAARSGTGVARILSLRPLVGLGLISYSAYLVHQPLLAFAEIRGGQASSSLTIWILIAASVVLGALSWRYIEQPFRTGKIFGPRRAWGAFGAFVIVVIGFGAWFEVSDGVPQRLPPQALAVAAYATDRSNIGACDVRGRAVHPIADCADTLQNGRARVLFIGDSHSVEPALHVQAALTDMGVSSYFTARRACIPVGGIVRGDRRNDPDCTTYLGDLLPAARDMGVETIVVTARWPAYAAGGGFDDGAGHVEREPSFGEVVERKQNPRSMDDDARRAEVAQRMADGIADLTAEFNVVLVYPVPEVGRDVPVSMSECYWAGQTECGIRTSRAVHGPRTADVVAAFDAIDSSRLWRVYPIELFCDAEFCDTSRDGVPLYSDDNHLAKSTGGRLLLEPILSAVLETLQP